MARSSNNGSTDTTSVAQGRFTVQLPSDIRDDVILIGKSVSDAVKASTGVGVDFSMAQVVTAVVKARAGEIRSAALGVEV